MEGLLSMGPTPSSFLSAAGYTVMGLQRGRVQKGCLDSVVDGAILVLDRSTQRI